MESLANEIALRFEIEAEHADALAEFLRESVEEFNPNRKIKSAVRQQVDLREELEAVADAQQWLAEVLGGLSLLARDRLWHSLWEMPDRPPNHIGYATLAVATDFPDETAFRESLADFEKRIEARLVELRAVKDKGGQPENTGLHVWVARARNFWERTLDRKFTYQYVPRGVHKGEAFLFCSFVLQRISPKVTEAELATAIRAMIKPMKVTFRDLPPREG